MKDALRCLRCKTVFPVELVEKWGRSAAADGVGADPKCPALVPAIGVRPAIDGDGHQHPALELCRGMLAAVSVADNTEVEDIGTFGERAEKGYYPGHWRQKATKD